MSEISHFKTDLWMLIVGGGKGEQNTELKFQG